MEKDLKLIQGVGASIVTSELFYGRDDIHDIESSGWNISFTMSGIRCHITMDPPSTECVPEADIRGSSCPSE